MILFKRKLDRDICPKWFFRQLHFWQVSWLGTRIVVASPASWQYLSIFNDNYWKITFNSHRSNDNLYYFRYKPPIDNYHQIAEGNVEWGATHDAWIYSIITATEVCFWIYFYFFPNIFLQHFKNEIQPDMAKVVTLFRALPEEILSKRTTTEDLSFSVERLPFGKMNNEK